MDKRFFCFLFTEPYVKSVDSFKNQLLRINCITVDSLKRINTLIDSRATLSNPYPNACMHCREVVCTIFMMVFGMTQWGREPTTYRVRGGLHRQRIAMQNSSELSIPTPAFGFQPSLRNYLHIMAQHQKES